MQTNRTRLIIEEGQFWRETVSAVSLGTQDRLIAGLCENAPVFIPRIANFNNANIHSLVNGTRMTLITEIKTLPFNAGFSMTGPDGSMVLDFSSSVKINEPWPISVCTPGRGIFALSFGLAAHAWKPTNAYLWLELDKELRKMPYPNVYDDGRVCMGRDWDNRPMVSNDALGNFVHAYNTFYATSMNGDLVRDYTFQMFARNPKGWVIHNTSETKRMCAINTPAFMQGYQPEVN